mmetsp:Transcript_13031/g.31571  ORF Transcript_13031/g.31571 Transcript_13031/m.31571 type:complete len:83 (-) Transcript_13031:136-384(-)
MRLGVLPALLFASAGVEDEEREGVSANAGGEFATHREGVEVVDGGVVHVVECSCWTIASSSRSGSSRRRDPPAPLIGCAELS